MKENSRRFEVKHSCKIKEPSLFEFSNVKLLVKLDSSIFCEVSAEARLGWSLTRTVVQEAVTLQGLKGSEAMGKYLKVDLGLDQMLWFRLVLCTRKLILVRCQS